MNAELLKTLVADLMKEYGNEVFLTCTSYTERIVEHRGAAVGMKVKGVKVIMNFGNVD